MADTGSPMNAPNSTEVSVEPPEHARKEDLLLRTLPYLVVLALTIAGVAFTSITHTPLIRYWELLAVATAIICVTTGWPDHDKEGRFELVWKQAAHWTAIIVAMRIVLLPDIQTMYTGPATGYTLSVAAGARHVSRWAEYFISTLCPGLRHGDCRAGDALAQTNCPLGLLDCRSDRWNWSGVLAALVAPRYPTTRGLGRYLRYS